MPGALEEKGVCPQRTAHTRSRGAGRRGTSDLMSSVAGVPCLTSLTLLPAPAAPVRQQLITLAIFLKKLDTRHSTGHSTGELVLYVCVCTMPCMCTH